MGVQLHPLHRRGVLTGLMGIGIDVFWLQHQVAVPGQLDIALYLQPHPRLDVLF